MLALELGDARVARMLINAHANIEAVDTDGFGNVRERVSDRQTFDFVCFILCYYSKTPLMLAAWHGHAQFVRMLINAHANLEAVNKFGFGNVRERVIDGLTFDFVASLKQQSDVVGGDRRPCTSCAHVDRRARQY